MRKTFAFLFGLLVCVNGIPKEGLLKGHIITGDEAEENQFPFLVSIRIKAIHYCAGSILNHRWVLTAAHCKYDVPLENYSIIAGSIKLNTGGTQYKISEFIPHEYYNSEFIVNDIALIKTAEPITFTPSIQPIKLPEADIADYEYLIASGWGFTSTPGTTPNDLMYIYLRTINQYSCQLKYGLEAIGDGHLCTYTKKGFGICSGDSGGPLTALGFVYGVATWTRPCSLDGHPDVFTRVYFYLNWIDSRINLINN